VRNALKSFLLALMPVIALSCASKPSVRDIAKEYAGLGDVFFELKRYDKAGDAYARALALYPELEVDRYQLARAYAENSQFDKALVLLKDLSAKDEKNVIVMNLYAYVLLKKGDDDGALAAYEKVLAMSPYGEDSLFNAGIIHYKKGNFDRAVEIFGKLNEVSPKDEGVMRLLAEACFASGKRDRGFELMAAYSSVKDKDPEGFKIVARERAKAREYALALEAYGRYLALKEDDAGAWFERARLELLAAKDEGSAKESLEKAIKAGYKDEERMRLLIDLVSDENRPGFESLLEAKKGATTEDKPKDGDDAAVKGDSDVDVALPKAPVVP
jgi:tetratricopeptide (TPR) repeat protein